MCSVRNRFLTLGGGQASITWVEIIFLLEDPLLFSIPGCVYNRGLYCGGVPYTLISFSGELYPLSSKFKHSDDGLGFSVV